MSDPMGFALSVLHEDAIDERRSADWRYGVRHALTLIERALATPPESGLREYPSLADQLTIILDNASESDCTPGFYDTLRAALSTPPENAMREAAEATRDLLANYLWNEDDSGDEDQLEAAYDRLAAILGPSTEEGVGQTLAALIEQEGAPNDHA